MTFLISPTERDALKYTNGRGIVSSIPERYGADFLIFSPRGRCGIQRKKFPDDFFASIDDGRLAKELSQLAYLEFRLLVPEGDPQYTSDGHLMDERHARWTRRSVRNYLRSVRIQQGVDVEWSCDLKDTVDIVCELEEYLKTDIHRSTMTRPKNSVMKGEWGEFNKRDWARYFLQGLPGVGSKRAEAIFDTFGRVPLEWSVSPEEMQRVWGIGKKTARTLFELFS